MAQLQAVCYANLVMSTTLPIPLSAIVNGGAARAANNKTLEAQRRNRAHRSPWQTKARFSGRDPGRGRAIKTFRFLSLGISGAIEILRPNGSEEKLSTVHTARQVMGDVGNYFRAGAAWCARGYARAGK